MAGGGVAEARAQLLQQEAEGIFAVGVADRAERAVEYRRKSLRSPLWANTQ
jgi:hypothetical protein